MGLFDKIFGKAAKRPPKTEGDYKLLTGYQPVFSSFGGQLYEQELVRAAIHALANHTGKLKVEFSGHGADFLRKRLAKPNALQTWSQWLYNLRTIYECENTAFIVPCLDNMGRTTELYIIRPTQAKLVQVNSQPWLAFMFADGHMAQVPVWRVGVLTKFQYKNAYFGETNRAMRSTLSLIDIQNQGITEGIKSAATYRFMAQYNNVAFGDDLAKEQKRFNDTISAQDGGMALLFPSTYNNIQQINSRPFVIDSAQMEQIRKNVFFYFGVNEDVLMNKTFGDSWTAFYEGGIESFAIQLSEVLTAMLVLNGELSGDAAVMATSNRLAYMSNAEKLNVSSQLADRGVLNRDEVREIWNLPPLPNGEGQSYTIRGEYKNANDQLNGNQEGDDSNAD